MAKIWNQLKGRFHIIILKKIEWNSKADWNMIYIIGVIKHLWHELIINLEKTLTQESIT